MGSFGRVWVMSPRKLEVECRAAVFKARVIQDTWAALFTLEVIVSFRAQGFLILNFTIYILHFVSEVW